MSHIQGMEKALSGLTPIDLRHFAFDFAEKMKIPNFKDG